LGFAIPIVDAKPILESLKQYGYVKGRVALRIEGKDYSRGNCQGFRITKVLDDSCLEDTVAEDYRVVVITAVDGVTVTDYDTLRAELTKHKVGDKITLTLMCAQRVSDEMTAHEVKVVLQEQTAN
jgi:serine protease Do